MTLARKPPLLYSAMTNPIRARLLVLGGNLEHFSYSELGAKRFNCPLHWM